MVHTYIVKHNLTSIIKNTETINLQNLFIFFRLICFFALKQKYKKISEFKYLIDKQLSFYSPHTEDGTDHMSLMRPEGNLDESPVDCHGIMYLIDLMNELPVLFI